MTHLTIATFTPAPLASYCDLDRLLLKATRLWVVFARAGRNPRECLAGLLGTRLAARFSLLMESIVVAWPEPFTTFPPCACTCSPDEATLMALMRHAEAGRLDAANSLLGEMLPATDRARLWEAACRCISEQLGAA